ncbi:MAG: hypothetical protein FD152_480 [Xanthobacteraceae bacterium]|nr:MAG: hypothetical protein FD152_480 [Xanthobacteraceae bacterium]
MRQQILFRAAAISLIALGAAGCETTRPASTQPTLTVPVRDYPAERQQRLAEEISSAPAGAVWPEMIGDYSTLRRSACAVTPNQAACRRICAAEQNRPAFCRRI